MPTSIKIRNSDLVKFEQVKSLITNDIMVHHTIAELSARSTLNEFKLKVGFKMLYGQSIYEFLQDQRMKRAMHLLSTSEDSIQAIAVSCGYGYATNFTAVFRKKYKIKPSDYRRLQLVNKDVYADNPLPVYADKPLNTYYPLSVQQLRRTI